MQWADGVSSALSFPRGNGKVDLAVRAGQHQGLIEDKSFVDMYELNQSYAQTAGYAKQLGLDEATMAVFVPVDKPEVLQKISTRTVVDGVQITVVAIGWT